MVGCVRCAVHIARCLSRVLCPRCAFAAFRRAFQGLAYTKIDRVPLYLEWAPLDVFTRALDRSAVAAAAAAAAAASARDVDGAGAGDDSGAVIEEQRTLYVKNLNFASTEEGLRAVFSAIGDVRAVMIPRRKRKEGGEEVLRSMGYGFIEFGSKESALEAIKR